MILIPGSQRLANCHVGLYMIALKRCTNTEITWKLRFARLEESHYKILSEVASSRSLPQLAQGQKSLITTLIIINVINISSDLDEECGHALRRIVIAWNCVDHADRIDETADALRHADRLAAVQGITELLQCIQVLHVVLGFVRCIRQLVVVLIPCLQRACNISYQCTALHNAPTPTTNQRSSFFLYYSFVSFSFVRPKSWL